jgi:thiol-disulfide isomerase/thioredoxin
MLRIIFLSLALITIGHADAGERRPLPAFTATTTDDWLNSAPLRVEDLRGKVVLLDVWTFGCWNCYRSFPWLNALEARLADSPFQVIGIHSPEFAHERDPAQVRAKIAEFGLRHPVMLDNDFAYWRALGNRYWPAYYLVDKHGDIRELHVGETHEGDARASAIEERIGALLAE